MSTTDHLQIRENLQARLAALEARAEISALVALFCDRVDHYDIDGLDAVFTHDCFTDYGPSRGGPVSGLDAVQERIRAGQAEFRRTHHQLGQIDITLEAAGALARSYVTATHEDWEGQISRVHLRYHDILKNTPHGWRIARRTVKAYVVDGMPGEWDWVDRGLPPGQADS